MVSIQQRVAEQKAKAVRKRADRVAVSSPKSVEQVQRGVGALGKLSPQQKIAQQAGVRASAAQFFRPGGERVGEISPQVRPQTREQQIAKQEVVRTQTQREQAVRGGARGRAETQVTEEFAPTIKTRRQEFITAQAGKIGRGQESITQKLASGVKFVDPVTGSNLSQIQFQAQQAGDEPTIAATNLAIKQGLSLSEARGILSKAGTEQFLTAQEQAAQASKIKKTARGLAVSGAEGIKTDNQLIAEKIAETLKLGEDVQIRRNSDGSFTVEDVDIETDPFKRADARNEELRKRSFDDINKSFGNAGNRIREQFTFSTGPRAGELTNQGRRLMQELLGKKKQTVERTEKDFKFQKEEILLQEVGRKAEIEKKLKQAFDPAKILARERAQSALDRIQDIQAETGLDFSGAEQVMKNQLAKSEDLATMNKVASMERTGSITTEDPSKYFQGVNNLTGNIQDTIDIISATKGDAFAEFAEEEFQRARGQDEESIELAKLNRVKDTILAGQGDEFANQTASLLTSYGKSDPTGFLQEEFARNIINSPDTNFREKTMAELALTNINSKRAQVGIKKSVTKDRFGNILLVDPFTGAISPAGQRDVAQSFVDNPVQTSRTVDSSISTNAKDLLAGNVSASDLKTLHGAQKAEEIGREATRIREAEQAQGKVLTDAKARKLNSEIRLSNDFKSLDTVEQTINALGKFEKVFKEFGFEVVPTKTSAQYRQAQLVLKEFFNLGVLNGQDLVILEQILPPPFPTATEGFLGGVTGPGVALGSALFGARQAGVENGIKAIKDMIGEQIKTNLQNLEATYGGLGDVPALNKSREQAQRSINALEGIETPKKPVTAPVFSDELLDTFRGLEQSDLDKLDPERLKALQKATLKKKSNTKTQGTRPIRNKNPINLKSGGIGDEFAQKDAEGNVVTDDQGHLVFDTPEQGKKAAEADLKAKISGGSRFLPDNPTIRELGKVFAEDINWASAVASILGVGIDTSTQDVDFNKLLLAVARQEGGISLIKNS